MNVYHLIVNVIFYLLLSSVPLVIANPNYVASYIPIGNDYQNQDVADMNGDGLNDIVVSRWDKTAGREILIFEQTDGRFDANPSRRIELKKDIVAYGLADTREAPGAEIIFLTRSSVFSLSSQIDGYGNNLARLGNWSSAVSVSQERGIAYLGKQRDLNGDGKTDLLLPGMEAYGIFFALDEDDQFAEPIITPSFITKAEITQGADFGFQLSEKEGIEFSVTQPSPFDKLIDRPPEPFNDTADKQSETTQGRFSQPARILDLARWIPPMQAAPLQTRGRTDFIFIDDGSSNPREEKQLHLLLSNGESTPTYQHWQTPLRASETYQLAYINNDELLDVVALDEQNSRQTTVLLYLNRGGKFAVDRPDQVLRIGGSYTHVNFVDLNGDQRRELLISSYELNALDAVRSGSVTRSFSVYAQEDSDTPFAKRPTSRTVENFGADTILGLADNIDADVDIDGDGNKEAVSIDDKGNLIARTFDQQFRLNDDVVWQFPAERRIEDFLSTTINSDQASDFILQNSEGLTVLVSAP